MFLRYTLCIKQNNIIQFNAQCVIIIIQDHGLLVEETYDEELVGGVTGRGKGSRWSRLSGNQQKELKDMRKRQRMENKKKKVLKMDSEGVSICICTSCRWTMKELVYHMYPCMTCRNVHVYMMCVMQIVFIMVTGCFQTSVIV